MKQKPVYLTLLVAILISGCTRRESIHPQDHLLQATIWYQQSAELRALYYQAYNWAARELDQRITEGSVKPLAVVLDIDETVLDNSPQTARQLIEGSPFSDQMWDEWCSLAEAAPLPGALDFTRKAEIRGVEVFYISNRGIHLLDATIRNLREAGFPYADSSHVLLKTETPGKEIRREKVRESHEVVMLLGDNLGDFSGIFDNRMEGNAAQQVMERSELFGTTFIILPNPLYGSWEKPFRRETPEAASQAKKQALRYYKP